MREFLWQSFSGSAIEKLYGFTGVKMHEELRAEEHYLQVFRLSFLSEECPLGVLERGSDFGPRFDLL